MKLSDIELPANRTFGLFFAAVFAVAAAYFLYGGATGLGYALFAVSALFFVVALVRSAWLLPLNRLWMGFGLLLGMVVRPLVLGLLFFAVFTPIAIAMRLAGRDELRLKRGSQASYWRAKETRADAVESFKHQF